MTWPLARLADLCEINVGRTPARANRAYWGAGHPWLSIADMSQGRLLTTTSEQITDDAIRETGGTRAEPGTVLMSFKLSIGKVGIVGVPMFTNEAIAALPIRDESRLDPDYLAWALDALDLASGANRAAMGVTLNKAKLARIAIPLPPLDEQRRIARVLDVADQVRSRSGATLRVLEEARTAVFASTVAASDGSWPLVPVADLADESNGGIRTGPFGSQLLHSEFVDEGIAVLGIDNAVANEFRWGVERHITEAKYTQLRRYTVHPGDVLITIMATCGRVAVVPEDIGRAINTKHLCCITLDRSQCLPEFLHAYFLRHPIARHHLASRAKGAIMAGLNMTIIKDLPVSLPPIDVQTELVDRLAAVDKAQDRAAVQREHLDSLVAALQQRAFIGAL